MIWTGYDERGFTTVYTSYPGTTPTAVTQLPATAAAAQPTTTASVSVDLALENAAETVPPVPKANSGVDALALLSTKICLFSSIAVVIVGSFHY